MSTVQGRPAQPSKAAPTSLGAFGGHKTALLGRPGIRRSTPDSEALASSDDETDHPRQLPSSASIPQSAKPARRTSWLNEIPSASTRKAATQLNGTYSPNNSLPATPSGDLTGWPQPSASPKMSGASGWGSAAGSSFQWSSTGIWNENRKDPPARLQEVRSSPTTTNAPSAPLLTVDLHSSLKSRAPLKDNAIPFSIPLHPTPKTYRSQSYSVGQLDPESLNSSISRSSGNVARGRGGGQFANPQHRGSRPGVLGDLGHDSGTLGRVREVDDDDENENNSDNSQTYLVSQARTIEQLTRENALLRQAASGQYEKKYRDRTSSSISAISASSGFSNSAAPFRNNRMLNNGADGGDLAIEDQEDVGARLENASRSTFGRLSEQLYNSLDKQQLSAAQIESRNAESAKRAQWQTSLGFGSIPEIPQSRRHSFADVPTRQGSISSAGKSPLQFALDIPRTKPTERDEGYGTYGEDTQESLGEHRECTQLSPRTLEEQDLELEHLRNRQFAASYFSGPDLNRVPQTGSSLHQAYASQNTYGRPHHLDHQTQPLFIVTFKCCRSDVFYVQEGTGLQVKPGDLVIVEADRGTDLGTVAHADISWEEARQLKEYYAEEHYKWLMLFSRQSQTGGPNAVNPNGLGMNSAPGSAVGGMGPPGAHGPQDPQAGELKPKLIKRLAQNHEIQTLRDKEGNEAKAKRVCQQKVVEHRLNMEILDAEFQMDWKKLTFYYFADAYINFNSLVTDLFKIYKTRIWMSAINPASFVTPTSSLNVPPPFAGVGVHGGRSSPAGRRRPQGHNLAQSSAGGYTDPADNTRSLAASQGSGLRNTYSNPYQSLNLGSGLLPQSHEMTGLPHAMYNHLGSSDPFTSYGQHYAMLDPSAPSFSTSQRAVSRPNQGERTPGHDWTGNFRSLTLGGP